MAFRQFCHRLPHHLHFRLLDWLPRFFLIFAILAGGTAAATADDEVDCSSLRLSVSPEKYDSTCELHNYSDYELEFVESSAIDGSHFLVIVDVVTNHRYIFRGGGGGLQSILKDYFTQLDVDKWSAGTLRNGFRTAEFISDFKSIPSECVAFERLLHKVTEGWRRRIIGFGCSRTGDRAQVYEAMDHVNFPE